SHPNLPSFPTRRSSDLYIGLGIGNAVEATGLGPYESATVRVSTSGKVTVYTGATPQGQSHKTTLAQIAADHFGCTPDDITIMTRSEEHTSELQSRVDLV